MSSKTYFIYGKHAVFSAIENSGSRILSIFVCDRDYEIPEAEYIIKKMDRLFFDKQFTNCNHQYIAAEVKPREEKNIEDFLNAPTSTILMLDQITDPHNFGAIIRSAAAFGASCIITPQKHSAGDFGTIAKTSAGTSELIPIYNYNLANFLDIAHKHGFWSYALDANAHKTIYEEIFPGKIVIIMGSEGKGVRKLVLEKADLTLTIPMAHNIESLNVSCASAIILAQIFASRYKTARDAT